MMAAKCYLPLNAELPAGDIGDLPGPDGFPCKERKRSKNLWKDIFPA